MSPPPRRRGGRPAAHSRQQIVDAAIAVLDRDGIRGFTLRGLALEVGGGLGSLYWHVTGKDEVVDLASDALVGRALAAAEGDATLPSPPMEVDLGTDDGGVLDAVAALRRLALALYVQMDAHPWLAGQVQLSVAERSSGLHLWERMGRPLAAIGLSPRQQFHGSTALRGYVVGVGAAMSAQDLHVDPALTGQEQLDRIVERWQGEEYDAYPWIRSMSEEFRHHDDLAQFAAGLDLLLQGLVSQATAR